MVFFNKSNVDLAAKNGCTNETLTTAVLTISLVALLPDFNFSYIVVVLSLLLLPSVVVVAVEEMMVDSGDAMSVLLGTIHVNKSVFKLGANEDNSILVFNLF